MAELNFPPAILYQGTELENGVELYEVRDSEEVRVYCRSVQRIKKEQAMVERRRAKFEAKLTQRGYPTEDDQEGFSDWGANRTMQGR